MTHRKLLLLVLLLTALTVISWDYTCGHTFEEMLHPLYCPVCAAFMSVETGVLLVLVTVFAGLAPAVCCMIGDISPNLPSILAVSVSPDRAPPVCS